MIHKETFTLKELWMRLLAIGIFQVYLIYAFTKGQSTIANVWLLIWVGYSIFESLLVAKGKFCDMDKIQNPYKYGLYLIGLLWLPIAYFLLNHVLLLLEGLLILWVTYTLSCYWQFIKGFRTLAKKTEYGIGQFKLSLLMFLIYELVLISLYALNRNGALSLSVHEIFVMTLMVFALNFVGGDMLINSGKWYETRTIKNNFRLPIMIVFLIFALSLYGIFSQEEIFYSFMMAQIGLLTFFLLLVSNYFAYKKT